MDNDTMDNQIYSSVLYHVLSVISVKLNLLVTSSNGEIILDLYGVAVCLS